MAAGEVAKSLRRDDSALSISWSCATCRGLDSLRHHVGTGELAGLCGVSGVVAAPIRPLLARTRKAGCRMLGLCLALQHRCGDQFTAIAQDAALTHLRHIARPLPCLHRPHAPQHNLGPAPICPGIRTLTPYAHLSRRLHTQPHISNMYPHHKIHKRHASPCLV